MIRVWRLCQAVHEAAAFSGEGARRYGGRWNDKGRTAVYTAATQSLAMLEILVHADSDLLESEYAVFAVDIPEEVAIERIALDSLPVRWQEEHPPLVCRSLGNAWLERARSAVLAVPSAIVPVEINYLLNPIHPDFAKLNLHPPFWYRFDQRLWRRGRLIPA